jgi:nanoRNase/pAp phosphatase (c-di-AMP/oligoRNAs hydrolase)
MIHLPLLSQIEQAPVGRKSFKFLMEGLQHTVFHKNYAAIFFERLDHADTLVIAADFIMKIEGVSRAVACGVFEGKLVVILRSLGIRSSNLGLVAHEAFGAFGSAGGHKNMARAEIEMTRVDPKGVMKPPQIFNFVRRRLREALARKAEAGALAAKKRRAADGAQRHQPGHPAGHEDRPQANRYGRARGEARGQDRES